MIQLGPPAFHAENVFVYYCSSVKKQNLCRILPKNEKEDFEDLF